MGRHVAFLRGINVGGNKLVSMARLRDVLEQLGFAGVATLLQSGNVVFTAKAAKQAALEQRIEDAIASAFGFEVSVLVRSRDELARVLRDHPFRDGPREPSRYVIFFLSRPPGAAFLETLPIKPPEAAHLEGRELYALFPGGLGRSKLALALAKPRKDLAITGRNWATLEKLLALADAERARR